MSRATIVLIAAVVVVILIAIGLASVKTEVPVTHIEQAVANDAAAQ
jgi:hypothetical protein